MVEVHLRTLVPKNVLVMIGSKRTAVFPLRVADAVPTTDCDPTIFADRVPLLDKSLPKPRYDHWCFWFELSVRDVVVGQCAVEGILAGNKIYGI